MVKALLYVVGLVVLLYVTFFVPLGERTLYEHLSRIAATEEAQDLGREAGEASERLGDHVKQKLRERRDGGVLDGTIELGSTRKHQP